MIREKELHLVCKNYTLKGVQKPVKENPYKVAGVILRVLPRNCLCLEK